MKKSKLHSWQNLVLLKFQQIMKKLDANVCGSSKFMGKFYIVKSPPKRSAYQHKPCLDSHIDLPRVLFVLFFSFFVSRSPFVHSCPPPFLKSMTSVADQGPTSEPPLSAVAAVPWPSCGHRRHRQSA